MVRVHQESIFTYKQLVEQYPGSLPSEGETIEERSQLEKGRCAFVHLFTNIWRAISLEALLGGD